VKGLQFSKNRVTVFLSVMFVYTLWLVFFVGFRSDHYGIIIGLFIMFFGSEKTHKIICGVFCFLLFAAMYDSLRVLPGYSLMPVHIEDLYNLEKSWFGIDSSEGRLTPNEYFAQHLNTVLDFVTGISYLSWMPFPIAVGAWLTFKNPQHLMFYSFCFLVSNFIGISLYYIFPAAPPWYVFQYGFEFIPEAPGSASFLSRFDQLVGLPIFQGIYGKSSNVFGAIPSMHAAYPLITSFYLFKYKYRKLAIISVLLMLGTWFGAVYSMQHYVIDVILGIMCAFLAILICEKILYKTIFKNFLYRLASYIA